jgi:hypothetical protein
MNNFKVGDVVVCTDNFLIGDNLKVGKTYVIEDVGGGTSTWAVKVEGRLWSYRRFDLLDRPSTSVLTGMTKFLKDKGV